MEELAKPAGPRSDVVGALCQEFMQFVKVRLSSFTFWLSWRTEAMEGLSRNSRELLNSS